jgi:leader peptidase (prepilin peptidase)/N-methyltransferase
LVATVFERITNKEGMGAGDLRLLAVLNAWFEPLALILLLLIASVSGALVGIWLQAINA